MEIDQNSNPSESHSPTPHFPDGPDGDDIGRQSKVRRVLLLGVPTLLFAVVSILLWIDFQDNLVGNGQPGIATTSEIKGKVRRRPVERFRWFAVKPNSSVVINDSIVTDQDSSITLLFDGGTEVEVGENSLVTLQKKWNQVALGVNSGKIKFKSKQKGGKAPLLIAQHKVMSIGSGETSGDLDVRDDFIKVNVEQGNLSLEEGSQSHPIETQQTLQIGADGSKQVIQSKIKLLQPSAESILVSKGDDNPMVSVGFNWSFEGIKAQNKQENARLEVSPDPTFKTDWQTIPVQKQAVNVSLPTGTYYWRIRLSDSSVSEARRFQILKKRPVVLLEPENGAKFSTETQDGQMLFSWRPQEGVKEYILTLADNIQFKDPFTTLELKDENRVFVRLPKSKTVYWRVESRFANTDLNSISSVRNLVSLENAYKVPNFVPQPSIQATEAPQVSPKPSAPVASATAPINMPSPRAPLRAATAAPSPKFIAPSPLPKAKETPAAAMPPMKLSAPEFKIGGISGASNEFRGGQLSKHLEITVSWKPIPTVKKYTVLYSKSKSFASVDFQKDVQEPTLKLDGDQLPGEAVYFRVKANLGSGGSRNYPDAKFNIKFMPPLPVLPKNNAEITQCVSTNKSDHRMVLLTWKSTNFTKQYELQVSRNSTFTKLLFTRNSNANFYGVVDPPMGKYWWRMRSLSEALRSGWSDTFVFTLKPCAPTGN